MFVVSVQSVVADDRPIFQQSEVDQHNRSILALLILVFYVAWQACRNNQMDLCVVLSCVLLYIFGCVILQSSSVGSSPLKYFLVEIVSYLVCLFLVEYCERGGVSEMFQPPLDLLFCRYSILRCFCSVGQYRGFSLGMVIDSVLFVA